jgi:hypothetical protein
VHFRSIPARSATVAICAAVLVQICFVGPAPVLAANSAACSTGSTPTGGYKFFWQYDATTTPYWVTSAIGDATVRPVYGCVGGRLAIVPVVNIQQYNNGAYGRIVQLGYFADSSGVPYLAWTPNDNADGLMVTATWFNEGYGAGRLVPGQYYRFDIYHDSSGRWKYCVRDVTSTWNSGWKCNVADNHWGTPGGNLVWWGYETDNSHSSLGPISGSGNVDLHWMQWLTNQSGAQWMVENSVSCLTENNAWGVYQYWCSTLNTAPGYGTDTLRAWSTSF